jgi:hypothetical protein
MDSGFLYKLRIAFEQLSAKKDTEIEIYSCSGHYYIFSVVGPSFSSVEDKWR